jgi:hypothetical protein
MCNYCGTDKYRKIYENHFGPIPKDSDGRSYEIHHIDGDHTNNDLANLKCITIQEHYDIHYNQDDYSACYFINIRSKLHPDEISKLATLSNLTRIENGTHNFLREHNPNFERIENGTHNFLGGHNPIHERIASGLQQKMSKEAMTKLVENGTHNWLKQNGGSEKAREYALKRIEDGTHHFLDKEAASIRLLKRVANGTHPNKVQETCPHCELTGGHANMRRYHFDNCKFKCD